MSGEIDTIEMSSTQVDTTGYGPNKPYSSNKFITVGERSTNRNNNLRGKEDGTEVGKQ
jgi:hypothetical protein